MSRRLSFDDFDTCHRTVRQLSEGFAGLHRAVILAGENGQVYWLSALARDWLGQCFGAGSRSFGKLPAAWAEWFAQARQSAGAGRPAFSELPPPKPSGARLLGNCGPAGDGAFIIVLTRERAAIAAQTAGAFGLTPREAEILFWLSEAKTNPEIAGILGVSLRTIHKHAEHLFAKLGVENRLAAQRLGWELRRL